MSETKTIPKKFCESLESDLKRADFVQEALRTGYVKKIMKEYVLNDAAPALGEIVARVSQGFYTSGLGRKLCWVVETDQPKVRFYKVLKGLAGRIVQGAPPSLIAGTPSYVDVDADIELGTRIDYSLAAVEDIPQNVRSQVEIDGGRALGVAETVAVKAVLDAIANADLAGGAAQSPKTANTFVFVDVMLLLGKLLQEGAVINGSTYACCIHPDQWADALSADAAFINSQYKTSAELAGWPNAISQDVFNIVYIVSADFTAATAYLINVDYALGMPIRRDVSVKPWEQQLLTGVDIHERIGVKVVNSKAVSKMTTC